MPIKNSNYTIGDRIRDITNCSAVPQPTAPPHAQFSVKKELNFNPFRSYVGPHPRPTIFLFPMLLLIFNPFQSNFSATRILPSSYLFWAGKGWWVTCNYPTVLKEKNRNRKNRNVGHYDFPVPDTFLDL
jgi:hypothetical protein